MNCLGYSKFVGLSLLLLAMAFATAGLSGQTTPHRQPPPHPKAAATFSIPEHRCENIDFCAEQIASEARNIEQGLTAELQNLQEQIDKEVEMSSPELAKLQSLSARLDGKKDELEVRAQELAAQAEDLAAQAQDKASQIVEQEPTVFISSSEDAGGWLGVEIAEVTPEKAKDLKLSAVRGVMVMDVEPESPAAKAGLKENDVITEYDGQTVEGTVQFRRLVRETPPGRNVKLAISREGSAQNISLELGDRGAYFEKKMKGKMRDFGTAYAFSAPNFNMELPDMPEVMDPRTPILGISAEDLTGQLGAYFGAPGDAGILVREVRAGTPAGKAGLKAGDVIIKINGKSVRSLGDLREQLRDLTDQKSVSLGILRKGSEINLPVTVEKPRPVEPMHMVHRAQL